MKNEEHANDGMKIGSLFSGVGGFELGLEWAGLGPVAWQVERDPFCRGILASHWPNARRFDDVATISGAQLGFVDVICGGFPCQDLSNAGKRAGIAGERSGLWRHFARIVGEIRPKVVTIENVAAIVSRGLDTVISDLERLGYRCDASIIAASDVGAPHRRERLFIVAYADGERLPIFGTCDNDSNGDAFRHEPDGCAPSSLESDSEAKSGMGRGTYGLPDRVDRWPSRPGNAPFIWEPSRALTHESPTRIERIHALGNAVVPDVARIVGTYVKSILDRE